MGAFTSQIAVFLGQFRRGNRDAAFFGLVEADHSLLPELIATFRSEPDAGVRAFIVEVTWQHRQQSVIPFLCEALQDPEPLVWRQALDGLVTLASPDALAVLRASRQSGTNEFHTWLEEAIQQVEVQMRQCGSTGQD